jgi:hypothetical protein
LLFSSDIIAVIQSSITGRRNHAACIGDKGNACRIFVGNPEGNTTLKTKA